MTARCLPLLPFVFAGGDKTSKGIDSETKPCEEQLSALISSRHIDICNARASQPRLKRFDETLPYRWCARCHVEDLIISMSDGRNRGTHCVLLM